MADALSALARVTDTSLLFDARAVAGVMAPAVHGRLTLERSLEHLLRGSGLEYVRLSNGAITIRRAVRPVTQELTQQPAATPEILVVGRRALNVDLVRGEDDIQPRIVLSAEDIARSGSDSADEFLKTRLADNAVALLSTQSPVGNYGGTRSLIDLKGLGAGQTLVLVDGHRLPSFPALDAFDQSNINGIPLNAIERIEILPSTAGGIYGPDATGGVVNVILKHDANGIDIGGSRGITQQNDDPTMRITLHAGFTSPGGGTKADIFYEHATEAGLNIGQRSYETQAQIARFTNVNALPASDNFPYSGRFPAPYSNSINIVSDEDIYLSPQLGGGSIGSRYTFIPVADLGTPQEAAILRANAGKLDFSMPATGFGANQSLLTRTERDGGVVTLRQRISDHLDGFLDLIASRERGTAIGGLEFQSADGDIPIANLADSPVVQNPDGHSTQLGASYPPIADTGTYVTTDTLLQATGGLIAPLGHGWQAEGDLTWGRVASQTRFPLEDYVGLPDPFAGAAALQAFTQSLATYPYTREHAADRLLDGSIHLAGTLLRLPAGPATVTLEGEWRSDQTDGIHYTTDQAAAVRVLPPDSAGQTLDDKSAYAELRAPLIARTSPIAILRGLELQLALRGDLDRIVVPQGAEDLADYYFLRINTTNANVSYVHERYAMLAYTIGAKTDPLPFLTFRTSFATGYQPPDASALAARVVPTALSDIYDPERDDESLKREKTKDIDLDGASNLRPSQYQSLLIGGIFHAQGVNPLRLSIDFNHLHASRQVFVFPSLGGLLTDYGPQYLLDNESLFPGRVIRAPLTPADIRHHYTVGKVIEIDNSAASSASTSENSIDFDLRTSIATPIGNFRLTTTFDWILKFQQQTAPGQPWYSALGTLDGPSSWKGNLALGWSKGIVSIDTNLQLFSAYRLQPALDIIGGVPDVDSAGTNFEFPAEAGRTTLPIQAYLDGSIAFKLSSFARHPATIRFSCQDMFNTMPPLYVPELNSFNFTDFTLGYSYYGDPRGRRFTLGIDVTL